MVSAAFHWSTLPLVLVSLFSYHSYCDTSFPKMFASFCIQILRKNIFKIFSFLNDTCGAYL